jgi:hypothetical protein
MKETRQNIVALNASTYRLNPVPSAPIKPVCKGPNANTFHAVASAISTVPVAATLAAANLTMTAAAELGPGSWPTNANDAGPNAINHNDADSTISP